MSKEALSNKKFPRHGSEYNWFPSFIANILVRTPLFCTMTALPLLGSFPEVTTLKKGTSMQSAKQRPDGSVYIPPESIVMLVDGNNIYLIKDWIRGSGKEVAMIFMNGKLIFDHKTVYMANSEEEMPFSNDGEQQEIRNIRFIFTISTKRELRGEVD